MAVDMFLKLTGQVHGWIKGESTDKVHAGWIEIESFSWGAISPRDAATGQPTGRRQYQPFRFVARAEKSMPQSLTAFATNESVTEAQIAVRRAAASFDYLTFKFLKGSIGSFDLGGGGEEPMLEYSLFFESVEVAHTPTNADGSPGSPTVFQDDWASSSA